MMTYVCQKFGAGDIRGQIPKSIYQVLNLVIFVTIFPKLVPYLNRMKGCLFGKN